MLFLRKPHTQDQTLINALYERSASIHIPWTASPKDYDSYLSEEGRYFLCLDNSEEIVGAFNISNIVRGHFQSAYLGYEVFHPHQGKGLMRQGLNLIIEKAFVDLKLHRLEANIQPGNFASIALASGAGFLKEGFSKDYLNIGGNGWKDHERWALVNEQWQESE